MKIVRLGHRHYLPAGPKRPRLSPARLLALALSAVLVLGLAAVGAAPAVASSSPSSTTLTVESDTSFSTFNPFLAYFDGDLSVIGAIYPNVTTTNEQGDPVPYLAKSWSVSADKNTWTFNIRSGLKWSDGKPITAADAAWTLNLIMHNSTAATANGALVADFASVSAPNATTLVVTTKQPAANMLYLIGGIPIVPEHIWASHVTGLGNYKNFDFPIVGYGPWIATGYAPNQYATLKANSSFFMGAPKYSKLVVQYYSNSDAAIAALRSGQLDQIGDIDGTQYEALKNNKDITLYPQTSATWTAIELNPGAQTRSGRHFGNGSPALQDVRVRDAIEMALNKPELVTKIWNGLATAGSGYLPPAYPQWQWAPSASQALSYDPAKANQLLTSAGYKMGSNGIRIDPKTHKPLVLRLGIHSDESTDTAMAPYIVEWLKAIGIQVTVQSMSFNQLNDELPKGNWDMLSDTWSTGPDPTYLMSIQTCGDLPLNNGTAGNTDAFFCNSSYDKLYAQQSTEFNNAQRVQTIGQMQQILYQQAVDVILYYPDNIGAVRTADVKDFYFGKANAKGFYPQQSNFINWRSAEPVAGASSGGTGAAVWIIVAVVVVLALAGAAVLVRRRMTAGERE